MNSYAGMPRDARCSGHCGTDSSNENHVRRRDGEGSRWVRRYDSSPSVNDRQLKQAAFNLTMRETAVHSRLFGLAYKQPRLTDIPGGIHVRMFGVSASSCIP